MTLSSIATFILIIVAVIIGDILCIGIQPNNNHTIYQWRNINNNAPVWGPQWNQNSNTTTPWPALGQRRNQQLNLPQNSQNARPTNQPMWIRQNNGPNWVRNNPTTPRNSANNANTNFLNNERGGVQNKPNQTPVSNKPGQNQVVRAGQLVGNGGGNNNSNNKKVVTSTGPKSDNTDVANEGAGGDTKNEGDVQDFELREFSEELLSKDTNNVARFVTVNLQGMTTSRSTNDEAPLPLLSIDNKALSTPSIEQLLLLYNNYILEANQNEVYTAQERIEENNLLDTILSTSVMQHARNFLIKKGKLGKDPKEFKDLLRTIWFGMYSRGHGRIGSSGFEHVFLAELKNSQVSGLHNWLYFGEEEKNNRANYLGYMRKIDLGNKGSILKYHFTFRGIDKPVGSMFIGTSPELEIALYSTCFILRADKICPLKMGGNKFIIRTYTYRYRGKNMIGSAFPEI